MSQRDRPLKPLPAPARQTRFPFEGAWHDAPVFIRDQLRPGHRVKGPAILIDLHQTVGGRARLAGGNYGRQSPGARARLSPRSGGARSEPRPIRSCSKCSTTCLCRIAEQMGVVLQNTAYSVQHQGAARFLLRKFSTKMARWSPTHRTCLWHLGSMDRAVETIIREKQRRNRPR